MKRLLFSFAFVLLAFQVFAQTPLNRKEELCQKVTTKNSLGLFYWWGTATTLTGLGICSTIFGKMYLVEIKM